MLSISLEMRLRMSADAVGVKRVAFTTGTAEVGGTAGSLDAESSVGVVV